MAESATLSTVVLFTMFFTISADPTPLLLPLYHSSPTNSSSRTFANHQRRRHLAADHHHPVARMGLYDDLLRNRDQCIYERQYAEMSTSSGVLGEDVISFGNQSEFGPQRAVFGCENVETGDLFSQHADGIMGLGSGGLSVVDQLVDKGVISDSFSLCYGGMEVGGGTMLLGGITPPQGMVFTESDPVRSLGMATVHITTLI